MFQWLLYFALILGLMPVIIVAVKNVDFDDDITVSLFHLDDKQLSRFSHEEISAFYTAFTE